MDTAFPLAGREVMTATLTLRSSCALCSGPLTEAMRLADTPLANEFVATGWPPLTEEQLEGLYTRQPEEAARGMATALGLCGDAFEYIRWHHSMTDLVSTVGYEHEARKQTRASLARPQELFLLTLMLCDECGHVQLREVVSPERLFRDYCYVSGTSPVFVEHFRRYAAEMVERYGLGKDDLIVEVGSNDGTLLREFKALGCDSVLGVDPAEEIATRAGESGVPTMPAFFTEGVARRIREHGRQPARLIIANNVFAHTADLQGFTRAVKALLAPDGVFVFEVSYLRDVVEKMLFDTIYHEHLSYHALTPLLQFFKAHGLALIDAERVPTHGGSIRCFVRHVARRAATRTRRLEKLIDEEKSRLGRFETLVDLRQRIQERAEALRLVIAKAKALGKRVAGFGAPAKLTTLMYEFDLGADSIDFIVDDSPLKQGKFTPGTHIPVLPTSALYERRPDVCVIFAWNFADSIIEKHQAYLEAGGRFIVPLPELREVTVAPSTERRRSD